MKTKKNQLFENHLKCLWDFDYFSKEKSSNSLLCYSIILLILLGIVNYLKATVSYTATTPLQSFFYTLIAVPIILLALAIPTILFITSFEGKGKRFYNSLLVFSTVSLPFFVIGHLLTWVRDLTTGVLQSFISLLVLVLFIELVVILIINLKKHFKTTLSRTITSIGLSVLIISNVFLISYVSVLVSSLV